MHSEGIAKELGSLKILESLRSVIRKDDALFTSLHQWVPPDQTRVRQSLAESELYDWLQECTHAHDETVRSAENKIQVSTALLGAHESHNRFLQDCADVYLDILQGFFENRSRQKDEQWILAGQESLLESAKARYLVSLQVAKLKCIQPFEWHVICEQFCWDLFFLRVEEDMMGSVEVGNVDRTVLETQQWEMQLQKLIWSKTVDQQESRISIKRFATFCPTIAGETGQAFLDDFLVNKKAKRKCGRTLRSRSAVFDAVTEITNFMQGVKAIDPTFKVVLGKLTDGPYCRMLPRGLVPFPNFPENQLLSSKVVSWILASDVSHPIMDGKVYFCIQDRLRCSKRKSSHEVPGNGVHSGTTLSTISPKKYGGSSSSRAYEDEDFSFESRAVDRREFTFDGEVLVSSDPELHFAPASVGDLLRLRSTAVSGVSSACKDAFSASYGVRVGEDVSIVQLYVVKNNGMHGKLVPLGDVCIRELVTVYLHRQNSPNTAFVLPLEPPSTTTDSKDRDFSTTVEEAQREATVSEPHDSPQKKDGVRDLRYCYTVVYMSTQNPTKPWIPMGLVQYEILPESDAAASPVALKTDAPNMTEMLVSLSQTVCCVPGCFRTSFSRKTHKCAHHHSIDLSHSALRNESLRLLASGLLPFHNLSGIAKANNPDISASFTKSAIRDLHDANYRTFFDDWNEYPETASKTRSFMDNSLSKRVEEESLICALTTSSGRAGGRLWRRYTESLTSGHTSHVAHNTSLMRQVLRKSNKDEDMAAHSSPKEGSTGKEFSPVHGVASMDEAEGGPSSARSSSASASSSRASDVSLQHRGSIADQGRSTVSYLKTVSQDNSSTSPSTPRASSLLVVSGRSKEELENLLRAKQQILAQERKNSRELLSISAVTEPMSDKQKHLLNYLASHGWPQNSRGDEMETLRSKAKVLRAMQDALAGTSVAGLSSGGIVPMPPAAPRSSFPDVNVDIAGPSPRNRKSEGLPFGVVSASDLSMEPVSRPKSRSISAHRPEPRPATSVSRNSALSSSITNSRSMLSKPPAGRSVSRLRN
eukprot:ANDGO_04033.mRNA.1 hypothetical protein